MNALESNTRKLASLDRVRNTASTRGRLESLARAVEELKTRNMTAMELSLHLSLSLSGARKHLRDLVDYGVLEVILKLSYSGTDNFKLISNEHVIASFLEEIRSVELPKPAKKSALERRQEYSMRTGSRQIYSAFDDQPYKLSAARNVGEGKRDAMVAFLFGSNPDQEIIDLPEAKKEQTFDTLNESLDSEMS